MKLAPQTKECRKSAEVVLYTMSLAFTRAVLVMQISELQCFETGNEKDRDGSL